jgi:hypothetical protein
LKAKGVENFVLQGKSFRSGIPSLNGTSEDELVGKKIEKTWTMEGRVLPLLYQEPGSCELITIHKSVRKFTNKFSAQGGKRKRGRGSWKAVMRRTVRSRKLTPIRFLRRAKTTQLSSQVRKPGHSRSRNTRQGRNGLTIRLRTSVKFSPTLKTWRL